MTVWHRADPKYDPILSQYPSAALEHAAECLGCDLAEATDLDEPSGIAFIRLQLTSIEQEMARRQRHAGNFNGALSGPSEERRQLARDIKDRVSVLDLYHRHFPLQPLHKAGKSWRGRCVIHGGENSTAFSVFNDGRNWHCHNCGAGGDVFSLAALLYRTTDFPEVVNRLADEFGIEKPASDYSRNAEPLGNSISGIVLKPKKKRSFEPFERRDGQLVRV